MSREDSYRRQAKELRHRARSEVNVSTRPELELLALAYDRLADQAERNARHELAQQHKPEAVAEPRHQRRQPAQAQQQQQQQQQQGKRPR